MKLWQLENGFETLKLKPEAMAALGNSFTILKCGIYTRKKC